MTREEIYTNCMEKLDNHRCMILELPTGIGKSRLSIDLANSLLDKTPNRMSILLLVAKTVHKQNWIDEIAKWGGFHNNPSLTIECYESLKKYKDRHFDIVICDEGHHLASEARKECLETLDMDKLFVLSATISEDMKEWLKKLYNTAIVTSTLQDAISSNVLPEPKIYLIPLLLDDKCPSETIETGQKKTPYYKDVYANLWKYKRAGKHALISATQKQKLLYMNSEILFYKNLYLRNKSKSMKNRWLRLCGDRLQFLAMCKTRIISRLLHSLKDKRTLTFCASIKQAESLSDNCIHSKNSNAIEVLEKFNVKEINHITAVQMLNEGMNLRDCQYGIFANLNASKGIAVQKIGRLLRYKHPVIIIPFYKNTREEEILHEMLDNYDEGLIHTIDNMERIFK